MAPRVPARGPARGPGALLLTLGLAILLEGAAAEYTEPFAAAGAAAAPGLWSALGAPREEGRGTGPGQWAMSLGAGGPEAMQAALLTSDGSATVSFYYKFVDCAGAGQPQLQVDASTDVATWHALWVRDGSDAAASEWWSVSINVATSPEGRFAVRWALSAPGVPACRVVIDDVRLPIAPPAAAPEGTPPPAEPAPLAAPAEPVAPAESAAAAAPAPGAEAGPLPGITPADPTSQPVALPATPVVVPQPPLPADAAAAAPAAAAPDTQMAAAAVLPAQPVAVTPPAAAAAAAAAAVAAAPAAAPAPSLAPGIFEAFRAAGGAAGPNARASLWRRSGELLPNGRGLGLTSWAMNLGLARAQSVAETVELTGDGSGGAVSFWYRHPPCAGGAATVLQAEMSRDGGRHWTLMWFKTGADMASGLWAKARFRPPVPAAGQFTVRWAYVLDSQAPQPPGDDCAVALDDISLPALPPPADSGPAAAPSALAAAAPPPAVMLPGAASRRRQVGLSEGFGGLGADPFGLWAEPGRLEENGCAGAAAAGGGGGAWAMNLDGAKYKDLETVLLTSDGTGGSIEFWYKFTSCGLAGDSSLKLQVSNDGDIWRTVWSRRGGELVRDAWAHVAAPSAVGELPSGKFAVRWSYRGRRDDSCSVAIDDVTLPVAGPAAQLAAARGGGDAPGGAGPGAGLWDQGAVSAAPGPARCAGAALAAALLAVMAQRLALRLG